MNKNTDNEYDDDPVGVLIFPPVCSRCHAFCSFMETHEGHPSEWARYIDKKFVCNSCLTPEEKL